MKMKLLENAFTNKALITVKRTLIVLFQYVWHCGGIPLNGFPFGDIKPSKLNSTLFQASSYHFIFRLLGVFQIKKLHLDGRIILSVKHFTACGCCVGSEAESQLGLLTALRVLAWQRNSSMVDRATRSTIWLHVQKVNQPKQGG